MRTLDLPDTHHLSFAIGWMELGNVEEAQIELAKLTPEIANHPDVLEVRWAIAAAAKDWPTAVGLAERLVEVEPKRASGWLHRAYALRRVDGGGLSAAWDALLPAVPKFPKEPTISYNLACYACQLGQLDEARQWLLRARTVGERLKIKNMALADEDLRPFWDEVTRW
ncbi:MAG: tetratricopeptide repeat protein [Verrucomicrobiales bacterium]|nr:tetratricopeptide repeat protein [Verrucomicrobiales bacterium]